MKEFSKLTDLNLLYESFEKCKKGVNWKCSVQSFEANLLPNLLKIKKELESGNYKQKAFFEFDINERGKQRHIKSLHISDRVVQRIICDEILMPELKPYLIYDNGASMRGKGISFTRERLRAHLQKYYRRYGNKGYILLVDYSKFFDSIPHKELIERVQQHFDDEKFMEILASLIESFGEERSLGIGSQISQIFGIYYPTPVDNYCKIVKGCKYYSRYMDDLYVIHHDKEYLKEVLEGIRKVSDELGLTLNPKKTQIQRIDKGFNFLKIRHFVTDTGKVVRKPYKGNTVRQRRKLKRLKRKMDEGLVPFMDIYNSYKSWRGSIEKLNSHTTIKHMDDLFYSIYGVKIN